MCASCAARRRVGVVTGLVMEARIIARAANEGGHHRPHLKIAGPGAPTAQVTVDRLIAEGAEAILSFGLAGGLDPSIPPGALIVPEGVLLPESDGLKVLETDRRWRNRLVNLLSSGSEVRENPLLCSFEPVLGVADKAKLHQDSEAGAVDMESALIARAAANRSVPFLALRAVSDCAATAIPAAAASAMTQGGRLNIWPIIVALATGQLNLLDLLHVGRQSQLAAGNLSRAVHAALPAFSLA
jgi:adenosylhomocysteine nucleosidase